LVTISSNTVTDEKTYQISFYQSLFGDSWEKYIRVDNNTDGYTPNIIFEHKQNITAYGRSKAVSQALIYLTRFNANGQPVPSKIMLVSQDEQKVYVYDTADYAEIINDISQYAAIRVSNGIPNFSEFSDPIVIKYKLNSANDLKPLLAEIEAANNTFFKVEISEHNVYGWANYYYRNATFHNQKPLKNDFFQELKNPIATLKPYINPWDGNENDFTLIMDLLNDPIKQKTLGAFYTPLEYAKLSYELLKKAIARVPNGNDYVIIDRCAGTGNLEAILSDEEMSHLIVSTYELKEWYVLKNRIGNMARYIIPPIPKSPNALPENNEGFLYGANALTKEFIDNLLDVIERTKEADKVTVILYENPPYAETSGIEFQKRNIGKEHSVWKNSFVVDEMKKKVKGAVSNEISNAFIWSAFEYFVKDKYDSYVVFSPVKYYKSQHLVNKKFIDGYAFNRAHFHAKTQATIMCALWSGEEEKSKEKLESVVIKAIDLDECGNNLEQGTITVKRIHSLFSEKFYDTRKLESDTIDGIVVGLNGAEAIDKKGKQIRIDKRYNENILGYMVTDSAGFDNPRLHCNLLIAGKYNGNGFYLRKDNFLEKLPLFAASRYTDHVNDWKIMSMLMRSGDKAEEYKHDIQTGKLNNFLCKILIWTCLTHYSHMRSLLGTDGRLYINQLCFDGDTFGKLTLDKFIKDGYRLSDDEQLLLLQYKKIIDRVRANKGKIYSNFNSEFKYGIYQIDEEINIKIDGPADANGKVKRSYIDGDLNNLISEFKSKVKIYYIENLIDTMFKYELLK